LSHPDEYPLNQGRIRSNKGLDIAASEFGAHFEERHVRHSNALHCVMKDSGQSYHVGPLARYALNGHLLSADIQSEARLAGLGAVCNNPFKSIIVRALETLFACEESLRIIAEYQEPQRSFVEVAPRKSVGYAATEAPRGILYHRYEMNENGDILSAIITPPTSQNQKMIEDDLRALVPRYLSEPDETLRWRAEQAIRNYDPCISCATHFLKLNVERT
jgi:coenzyme F420-reducing hydrogenase alpha subunit